MRGFWTCCSDFDSPRRPGLVVPSSNVRRPDVSPSDYHEEALYFASGKSIKKMSLGMEALAADITGIRTVQYFGRKFIDSGLPLSAPASKTSHGPARSPLAIVVTLDRSTSSLPLWSDVFSRNATCRRALALVEKGITENPNEWRLYQDSVHLLASRKRLHTRRAGGTTMKSQLLVRKGRRRSGAR